MAPPLYPLPENGEGFFVPCVFTPGTASGARNDERFLVFSL